MMAFLRLTLALLIGASVIYAMVGLYARSLARERFEKRWASKPRSVAREDYVAAGMKLYARSARRRILLAIYIVPPLVIAGLIYMTNFR